jgi:hypothetical protein
METAINTSITHYTSPAIKNNTWIKLLASVDSQAGNKTAWFLFTLVFQGIIFLPIPAVLMYYYNAPIFVLPITFGLYLGSIIVGMGGSGIRVVIGWLLMSMLINLGMLALYTL